MVDWLTYPSEKHESQLGWWHSLYGKIRKMFQTTNQLSTINRGHSKNANQPQQELKRLEIRNDASHRPQLAPVQAPATGRSGCRWCPASPLWAGIWPGSSRGKGPGSAQGSLQAWGSPSSLSTGSAHSCALLHANSSKPSHKSQTQPIHNHYFRPEEHTSRSSTVAISNSSNQFSNPPHHPTTGWSPHPCPTVPLRPWDLLPPASRAAPRAGTPRQRSWPRNGEKTSGNWRGYDDGSWPRNGEKTSENWRGYDDGCWVTRTWDTYWYIMVYQS